MLKRTSLCGAALLLGATTLPLQAQAQTPSMAPGSMSALNALSPMDQLFMVRAAEGNLAEVTVSQLALQKSKNADVKAVAQKLVQEHGQAQAELLATARRKGINLVPMLSPTHQAVSDALRKAKGDNFDKMYMAAQLDDHENTVALFQTEIANGQDVDAKGFASRYLPPILGHTIQIYQVARQVGAPGIELRPTSPPIPPGVTPSMNMSGMNMGSMSVGGNNTNGMNMGLTPVPNSDIKTIPTTPNDTH